MTGAQVGGQDDDDDAAVAFLDTKQDPKVLSQGGRLGQLRNPASSVTAILEKSQGHATIVS